MYVSGINLFKNYLEPLFNLGIAPWDSVQKKVALVAMLAFSCIAACYTFYQIGFRKQEENQEISSLEQQLDELEEKVINNARETDAELRDLEGIIAKYNVDSKEHFVIPPFEDLFPNKPNNNSSIPIEERAVEFQERLNKWHELRDKRFAEIKKGLAFLKKTRLVADNTYSLLFSNDQEIHNYANLTFKGTSSLKEARIILIGETHVIAEHCGIERYILDRFGRSGDILLLEGTGDWDTKLMHNLDKSNWDNPELVKESEVVCKKMLNLLEHGCTEDQEVFQKLLHELCEKISTKRNKSLIYSVNKFLSQFPDKKIFVISGRCHLKYGTYNILNYLPKLEKCALVLLAKEGTYTMTSIEYLKMVADDKNMDAELP